MSAFFPAYKVRDKEDKEVLKTTKTYSSTRKLKIPQFIIEKLKKMPHKSDFIVNIKGKSIYDAFKRVLVSNNLPDIRFHDLRMLNASIMLKLKIPDKYAMERGGWSTAHTMKKVYQQLFDEERTNIDNLVDNYFSELLSHE